MSPDIKNTCKRLMNLEFNIFHDKADESNPDVTTNLEDIDPDKHLNFVNNCNYILDRREDVFESLNSNDFSLIHLNVRSIQHNFESLQNFLSDFQYKFDVIALTETWLNKKLNIEDYELDGYKTPHCQNRESRTGGGVLFYVRDTLSSKIVKNSSYSDTNNNILTISVTKNNNNYISTVCYRSPSADNTTFLPNFKNVIDNIGKKDSIVCGDFNYNLFNVEHHPATEEYYNYMNANSYIPVITKPTRVTATSATLIDHIWSNNLESCDRSQLKTGIIVDDLSDHLPIFFIRKSKTNPQGYSKIKFRVISDEKIADFKSEIASKSHDLYNIISNSAATIHDRVSGYFTEYKNIYNKHFPLKVKKVHNKTVSKPWITNDIQKLIKTKNFLYYKKLKQPTVISVEKYKQCKKDLDKCLRLSKRLYFERKLFESSKNMKERWDAIRTLINRSNKKNSNCPIKTEILGKHFSTIAEKLNSSLSNVECKVLKSKNANENDLNFTFNNVDAHTVYNVINKQNIKKGPGPDGIPVRILKVTANVIAPHLSIIFNECLNEGTYPNIFKISQCKPIFKGGDLDPEDPISYRPISILNAVNKIFERILHDQLMQYIERNEILPNFQFGYRKNHSTSQAVLTFAKEIENALDNKQTAIAIFMDLSKAFDTVDKNILIKKLRAIGVNDTGCKLLYDYMSNRYMTFVGDNNLYNLAYGVPQGSILGPLLFLIYIYDMKSISDDATSIVYADDTNLVIVGNNIEEATNRANIVLNKYANYFNMNKLSLNETKTKYMVFSQKKCSSNTPLLTINGSSLERVHTIKFLGVILNDKVD